MDVRTFEAFTMKDAIKSLKKALGSDAVILSTREKPAPGGRGTIFEVTAATSEARAHGASSLAMPGGGGDRLGLDSPMANMQQLLQTASANLTTLVDQSPTKTQINAVQSGMQELKLLLIEALRSMDGSPLQDVPAILVPIDRQLRAMGVEAIAIAELIKHLRDLPPPLGAGEKNGTSARTSELEQYYRDQAIRWMIKRVRIAARQPLMNGTTQFQAIVGAPGSGKSALVAKLAALHALKERHSVVIASLDNRRLAAADQMRVFCKIIDLPFISLADPADIANVTNTHRDAELVLIDTSGYSPKSFGGKPPQDLLDLKQIGLPIDFHLCLSITEKSQQLDETVRGFSAIGLSSLAFTKLDESWSYGEIFNLSHKWALPISYFSLGQQIPDDIERATRERVIERIFGL